jgi:hypothetical protein
VDQNKRLPIFVSSINGESQIDQIINLPANEFTIPITTAIPEFLVSGVLILPQTKQPTSITFYYRGRGGGGTDAYVELKSADNVSVYFKSPMPTSSSTPIVMTQLLDLPLTQNQLLLSLSCLSSGAGSMVPISLVINYD